MPSPSNREKTYAKLSAQKAIGGKPVVGEPEDIGPTEFHIHTTVKPGSVDGKDGALYSVKATHNGSEDGGNIGEDHHTSSKSAHASYKSFIAKIQKMAGVGDEPSAEGEAKTDEVKSEN